MVFGTAWVNHQGLVSCHSEVFAHCIDRHLPSGPVSVLHVGVDNGGTLEVLASVLPEGSSVLGLGDVECETIPSLVVDVWDRESIFSALGDKSFDWIIDSRGSAVVMWPYLVAGGKLFWDHYDAAALGDLCAALSGDDASWLPTEEILSVTVYPVVAVIEKRFPRVLPYIDLIVGRDDPVVSISDYQKAGGIRVLLEPQED
jgi:hypothetical protein